MSGLFWKRPRAGQGSTGKDSKPAMDEHLREALTESRQRYKDLVEISSDFAWEVGADGNFVFVSPAGALGWRAEDLLGRAPGAFLKDPTAEVEPVSIRSVDANPFLSRYPVENGEVWFKRADGSQACLAISVRPVTGKDGTWQGARGICRDVTEDRERDAALARAHGRERLFGYIVRTIRDEVDPVGMMNAAAKAISRALTAEYAEIYRVDGGEPSQAVVSGNGPQGHLGKIFLAKAMKVPRAVTSEVDGGYGLALATQYGGAVNGVLVLWRDGAIGSWNEDELDLAVSAAEHLGIVIEQAVQHERLELLSRTDGLTGLLNRRSFVADLARRHARVIQGDPPGALVYCDLDNFKQVNDTHGHERGDTAICDLARLLELSTRGSDLVARLGGDEFALWLEKTDVQGAASRARDILERAEALKAHSGGPDRPLSLSLGIAILDAGSDETLEALMARADRAMYDSKQKGKGCFTIAPPSGDAFEMAEAREG
ncbi:MAG TPA: diguanylate cyclase [Alphaproteobacteria bacterium]|nr:diguanylate cyclase [Alphaproteobacteria bacterium]